MNNDYSTLILETQNTNDLLETQNTMIETLNTNFSLLLILIFSLGVIKCSDMFHHLFDAIYKKK